jgi:hypothetical protein
VSCTLTMTQSDPHYIKYPSTLVYLRYESYPRVNIITDTNRLNTLHFNLLHLRNSLLNFKASVNFPTYKAVRIKYRDRVANSPCFMYGRSPVPIRRSPTRMFFAILKCLPSNNLEKNIYMFHNTCTYFPLHM